MKRFYLKERVENILTTINVLILMFLVMTIDSLGNTVYNTIAMVLIIVFLIIALILIKFGKDID
jgi:uncharacterized membrane protein YdbT with pleckstrin-like domain